MGITKKEQTLLYVASALFMVGACVSHRGSLGAMGCYFFVLADTLRKKGDNSGANISQGVCEEKSPVMHVRGEKNEGQCIMPK
ncbi:MAG: hypothetical protein IJV50_11645 [Lachnospiraceae bacterium]|nr:hypothetical protein [Lachnospiraceae bacterium]